MIQATKSPTTQAVPESNLNHETRTSQWFDTTYAIAIGIDQYEDSQVASLENAVSDANTIIDLLKKSCGHSKEKFEVHKLEDAKLKSICHTLKTLKGKVKENDRIIFYYAGHGIALPGQTDEGTKPNSQNPDLSGLRLDNKPRGYLIPADAVMGKHETYLALDQLLELLGDFECRHGLIILDCCYAGSIKWSMTRKRQALLETVYPTILDNYISKKAWFILTSSDEHETANDGMPVDLNPEQQLRKSSRNSPFVQFLGKALLEGEADTYPREKDCIITTAELEIYLRGEVTNATSEISGDKSRQTPQRLIFNDKHEGGEFVFLLEDLNTVKEELPEDPDVTTEDNPYCGLKSYSLNEQDVFFGRDRLTKQLMHRVMFGPSSADLKPADLIAQMQSLIDTGSDSLVEEFKRVMNASSEEVGRRDLIDRLDSFGQADLIRLLKALTKSGSERLIRQLQGFRRKEIEALLKGHSNKSSKLPLTVVFGKSGSGKSSLVNASLVPKLFPKKAKEYKELNAKGREGNLSDREEQRLESLKTFIEPIRPASFPDDTLKAKLVKLESVDISSDERCLLVIDQFEEVETLCKSLEQKENFWRRLIELLKEGKIDVVLTLRADFETTMRSQFESAMNKFCNARGPISDCWIDARFEVSTMEREELEDVIKKPASTRAVFFRDEELVHRLSREVAGMPGGLPLLSVALESMYKNFASLYITKQRATREITLDDYNKLEGGVPGAIRKKATEEYCKLSKEEQKMLRMVMMRMITRRGGQALVRKQVLKSDLKYPEPQQNSDRENVIQRFLNVRLFVSGSAEDGETYYEPAHDALVREWDYISAWLEGKESPNHTLSNNSSALLSKDSRKRTHSDERTQSRAGFIRKLLFGFGNIFPRRRKYEEIETAQSFDLTLLEDLSTAAKREKR